MSKTCLKPIFEKKIQLYYKAKYKKALLMLSFFSKALKVLKRTLEKLGEMQLC